MPQVRVSLMLHPDEPRDVKVTVPGLKTADGKPVILTAETGHVLVDLPDSAVMQKAVAK